MKKNKIVSLALIFAATLFSACSTIENSQTYKDTRNFYYTYINRPAVVDYTDVADISPIDEKLTKSFALLDSELTKLIREMDSILDLSNAQAVAGLFTKFPWISHIYALDPYGEITGALPSFIPEYANFDFILDREVKTREIYADIQESPAGYEIVVLRPYMTSGELQAFLAVSFDPKALLPFVGDPSDVIFLGEKAVLWTGDHLLEDTPFNLDWTAELKEKSYDTVSNEVFEGAWIARYLGGIRLVYGVMQKKGQSE